MKTKNIFRALLLMLAANCFALTTQAQVSVLCPGDSLCLDAGSFRGTIQWQESSDGVTFSNINGGTTSPFCAEPPAGTHWLRGFILEGTCDTLWTDTLQAIVSSPITASNPTNPWILSNTCTGTLFTDMTVSGGTGSTYTYDWSPSSQLNDPSVQFPVIIATTPGSQTYSVTITDSIGCSTVISGLMVEFQGSLTYNFTGGLQTLTTEGCYDSVFIQTWGAQGGAGNAGGNGTLPSTGGLGGYAEGWYVAASGTVMNVFVGGQGATPTAGFNGGGAGGSQNAGGGGGATDVRVGGTAEANRIITAGGGGGGGRSGCDEGSGVGGNAGAGGAGGGGSGVNGANSATSGGVAGGGFGGNASATQGLGGVRGVGCASFSGTDGGTATTGTGANGGNGQTCCCSSSGSVPGGGGGGGGFLGGGGGGGGSAGTTGCSGNSKGAGGGGGGGSSNTSGVINGVTNNGIWLGNGQASISW
jgi:hypothetical protein